MFFKRRKRASAGGDEAAEAAPAVDAEAEAGSTQFLTGDSEIDRRTMQVLLEAIAQVSEAKDDLEAQLREIVDRSVEVTAAERGLLLLRRSDGELDVRVARSREGTDLTDDLRFSTSVARRVLEELQPLRATVNTESEALDLGKSVFDLKLRAVMCVPLAPSADGEEESRATGVLYVDSRAATRQFSHRDLHVFAALAQHISIALENSRLHHDSLEKVRLEQSLELASAIQRDLMPGVPDDLEGFDVHGWYGPAERASGDFYDFIKVKDGRRGLVVGDVTGHGIGPALITATAQAGLRSYLRLVSDLGEVVSLLNQGLCERIEDGRFLTLFVAALGPGGSLEFINAGHCPPLVWRADGGAFEELGGGGPALGMIEDEVYRAGPSVELGAGDVLVALTDGILEARNPAEPDRMFGEEGLRRVVAEQASAGRTAKEITLAVVESVLELTGGVREDDITLVVARRT